eukprot:jgi/Tetstr1/454762/TSEL_041645.t1
MRRAASHRVVAALAAGTKRPSESSVAALRDAAPSSSDSGTKAATQKAQPGQKGLTELGGGASLLFVPGAFDKEDSSALFAALQREVKWQQRDIQMMGKRVMQPRLVAYMADDSSLAYTYSGTKLEPDCWHPFVLRAKEEVERLTPGAKFNSCLLNLYRNGSDHVGWHSDDEAVYKRDSAIASVSLGATRDFVLRRKEDPGEKLSFRLNSGDLLVMQGTTQSQWMHCLPKRTKVQQPRINLTFRTVAL